MVKAAATAAIMMMMTTVAVVIATIIIVIIVILIFYISCHVLAGKAFAFQEAQIWFPGTVLFA